jgi:hypothetical protein
MAVELEVQIKEPFFLTALLRDLGQCVRELLNIPDAALIEFRLTDAKSGGLIAPDMLASTLVGEHELYMYVAIPELGPVLLWGRDVGYPEILKDEGGYWATADMGVNRSKEGFALGVALGIALARCANQPILDEAKLLLNGRFVEPNEVIHKWSVQETAKSMGEAAIIFSTRLGIYFGFEAD